jgi:hypothetical protein
MAYSYFVSIAVFNIASSCLYCVFCCCNSRALCSSRAHWCLACEASRTASSNLIFKMFLSASFWSFWILVDSENNHNKRKCQCNPSDDDHHQQQQQQQLQQQNILTQCNAHVLMFVLFQRGLMIKMNFCFGQFFLHFPFLFVGCGFLFFCRVFQAKDFRFLDLQPMHLIFVVALLLVSTKKNASMLDDAFHIKFKKRTTQLRGNLLLSISIG